MLKNTCRAIRAVSLSLWLGGGVMLLVVARYVFFGGFVELATAGDIMASIFHGTGWMKIGVAALALGAHLGLGGDAAACCPRARKTGLIMMVLATMIALSVTFYFEPRMVELRLQFRNDPNLNNPSHQLFSKLHGASMGLSTLELLFVAIALICTAI